METLTPTYFCHACDKRVDSALQMPSGEFKCCECNEPYVEIISDTEEENEVEDEMIIEDWNPELDQDMVNDEQPEIHVNFNFNVNVNGENVFVASSRRSSPYSFVGGDRTELRMPARPSPPRARRPQPYSHVFERRQQQQHAPPRPEHRRQRIPQGFPTDFVLPPYMFNIHAPPHFPADVGGAHQNPFRHFSPNFGGAQQDPFGQHFFQRIFGNMGPGGMPMHMPSGVNARDFYHGNMQDLLARMHQQHEAENGKPPAAKSAIDKLPTHTLTKQDEQSLTDSCCAVCQDSYNAGETVCKLPCGHSYHKDCVVPWLERHCTCPVCRHEVGETQPEPASQAV